MAVRTLTLRHKLPLLLLFMLVVPLGLVGLLLSHFIATFHEAGISARFAAAFETVAERLAGQEQRLVHDVAVLAAKEEIISSVNMIFEYGRHPQSYEPLIFDPEKQQIAAQLRAVLDVTPIDQLAVYDAEGTLCAFAVSDPAPDQGILSFTDGRATLLRAANGWTAAVAPSAVPLTRAAGFSERPALRRLDADGLRLEASHPIIRRLPDGTSRLVGHVTGTMFLGHRFVTEMARTTGTGLGIFTRGGGWVGVIPGVSLDAPPTASAPLPRRGHGQPFLPHATHFLQAAGLPLEGGGEAYLLLGEDKTVVTAEITRTRVVVAWVLAVCVLIMVPLGILLARRTLSEPLERLLRGVDALRQGRYSPVVVTSADELGALAGAFNAMAATIREREAALRESEGNYRRMIETSEEGVWVIDARSRTLFANRRMAEMLATSVAQMHATSMFDYLDAADRLAAERNLERRRRGIREQHDFRFRRRDGSALWAILSASPILADDGTYIGALAMVTDITDRKFAEAVNAVLQEINQSALEGASVVAALELACRRLAELFDLPLVWISRPDDEDCSVLARAGGGDDGALPDGAGATAVRQARASGEPAVVVHDEPAAVAGEHPAVHAAAAFPLRIGGGEVIGVLAASSRQPNAFDAVRLSRLTEFAERAGVALQLARDQARLRLQGTAMESAVNAIVITDPQGRIEWVNAAFERLSGYARTEVLGKTPVVLKSGKHDRRFYELLWRTVLAGQPWQGEVINRRKDGSLYTVEQTITPLLDERGSVTNFIAIQEDVSATKAAEAHIRYIEQHDPLTGLPNRTLLLDRLGQALAHAGRLDRMVAVLQLDLDRFKNINDTLGQSVGDRLLCEAAALIRGSVRAGDTVSRQGGDEFTLILEDLKQVDEAAAIAEKLLRSFDAPFRLRDQEVFVSASIGISLFPIDDRTPEDLIKDADVAMYQAKERGRNTYRFFTADLHARASERLRLESALRRALERDELLLHYQPQVDLREGAVVAAEALIRWQHPEMGLLPPTSFIPIAEETGLIVPIGEWVLRTACRQASLWNRRLAVPLRVAVNLSAAQFKRADVTAAVRRALEDSALPAELLEVEITESELMEEREAAVATLERLRAMGVRIAIDDFGTGYSSLSQLKQLPLHRLKVDRSFVQDIAAESNGATIVSTIITLAHSLQLRVIAEGVEKAEQLDYLQAHGCDEIQGYFFSPPVDADALERLLHEPPLPWTGARMRESG